MFYDVSFLLTCTCSPCSRFGDLTESVFTGGAGTPRVPKDAPQEAQPSPKVGASHQELGLWRNLPSEDVRGQIKGFAGSWTHLHAVG